MPIFSYLLAALAGVGLVVQQAMNANLRASIVSPVWASVVSFAVGLTALVLLGLALREPIPTLAMARGVPAWSWMGGLFGAAYIALSIVLAPKIGVASFVVLLIAGQMTAAVLFDHFGLMGLPVRTIDLPRVIGIVLMIGGVMLIRR